MMMNKFFISSAIILLFSISIFSQTKSIADAQNEIKSFENSNQFSVVYNSAKYSTVAEVKFDIVEKNTPLAKEFKEFGFRITTLFANDGIDQKPVRSTLCINTRSKKFFFASARNLTLSLDNELLNFGEADRSTEVKGGKVREDLCWEIDQKLVKDMGNSSKITYEIGNVNISLDASKIQFFKNYANLLKIKTKPVTK